MVTTKLPPPLNVRQGDNVSFENGDLSLENGRWLLRPMKREDYRILRLPFHYNPNATCPRFEQFIKEVFRDDPDIAEKSKLIFELFGYSFQSHTRHEFFPILVGNGANGKSVLLYTLAHCVGDQNVAAIQPYSFNNSFQLASLQNKLINVITESEQGGKLPTAKVKALVSGEAMTVEHKHKAPFNMRPFATLWWGTNHLPNANDYTPALNSRARVIEFNRFFTVNERDELLKEKLKLEAPGIIRLALEHYAAAVENGFTLPESVKASNKRWKTESDNVALFAEEMLRPASNHDIKASELYSNYRM